MQLTTWTQEEVLGRQTEEGPARARFFANSSKADPLSLVQT